MEDDTLRELGQYITRINSTDFLSELPDNAYNFEKGNILLSNVLNDFIPFKRHFYETPSVSLWLTFNFASDEGSPSNLSNASSSSSSSSSSSNNNNNNNNNNNKNNNNNNNNSTKKINSPINASIYCYKLNPNSYELDTTGISIHKTELYSLDASAEVHYIAYNRTKPVDESMKTLAAKVMVGGPDIVKQVKEWVESGHYISSTNSDEQSLLHIAFAKWLVENGIELELCDKNGWTPIFCAVNAQDIPLVNYLVQNKALTKPVYTTNGSSLLHYLVRIIPTRDNIDLYLNILEKSCEVYNTSICYPNFALETPFHKSASVGNLFALVWFLDPNRAFNFDPNSEDSFGETVLHHAIKSGKTEVIQYLLQHNRIEVPPRYPTNSPYSLATKLGLTDIANLFPTYQKTQLRDMNVDLLIYLFEFLDMPTLMRCSMTSKNYKQLVAVMLDNTQKRKGMKSKSKINLWGAVDRAEMLLQEDLKAIISPQFVAGWHKYDAAPNTEGTRFVNIIFGGRRSFAPATVPGLSVGNPLYFVYNPADFAAKTIEYDGRNIKVQLWDPTITQRFRPTEIPNSHYKKANILIVLYENNSEEGMEDVKFWLQFADRYVNLNCLILFVQTNGADTEKQTCTREEMLLNIKKHCICPTNYRHQIDYNPSALKWPYVFESKKEQNRWEKVAQLASVMVLQHFHALDHAPARPSPSQDPRHPRSIVSAFKRLFR